MNGRDRQAGFTLLEVIIMLVVSAILMAAILPYVTMTRHSIPPIFWFERAMDLQAVMENITSRYEELRRDAGVPDPLQALGTEVGSQGSDQHDVFGGDYHVDYNGYIEYDLDNNELHPGNAGYTGAQENLRISIQNSDGLVLTTIFTDI